MWLSVVFLSILAWLVYGILDDPVTARICVEYCWHRPARLCSALRRARLGMQLLCGIVSLFCVTFWAARTPSFAMWTATTLGLSLTGAVVGETRNDRTICYATFVGGLTGAAFVLCDWIQYVIGYFVHEEAWSYFEDGVIFSVFIAPIILVALFSPLGALLGAAAGGATRLCFSPFRPRNHAT